MSDVTIPGLATQLTSVDRAADLLEVSDTSDSGNSKKASVNNLLDLTSHPVGIDDVQTLTNKTITAPTISSPVLSGTLTGTYTLGGTPTFPSSLATLTGIQTLTNKTLTSPTINSPTITNPTLTVDTISEFTSANGVTIDGLSLKDGKLNTNNSVVTTNITNDAVTATKIDWASTGADGGIWWEELARTTLSGAADVITLSSIPLRKYLYFFVVALGTGGTITANITFNNDTGNNYARRASTNSADSSTASTSSVLIMQAAATSSITSATFTVVNIASSEKLVNGQAQYGASGAATAPTQQVIGGKWANTTDQISRIDISNTGTGDYAIGSEIIVLGHN